MQFTTKQKFLPFSPYKLRPIIDVIRGKKVDYAIGFLKTYLNQRTVPVRKALLSAVANAFHLKNIRPEQLIIVDIRVDQGPIFKYFKPGAMGRANIQRRRLSHLSVTLQSKEV